MSRQEVITLPLPPRLRQQLLMAGFSTLADLENIYPTDLAREASITPEEALEVLKFVQSRVLQDWNSVGAQSAIALYEKQKSCKKIITFCRDIDGILGGGVWPGQVTEFCGVPGIGKTQLGIQLAIDVQIPAAMGGLEGQAIYIDTEGSFMIERVQEMATAAVRHIHGMAQRSGQPQMLGAAERFTLQSLLEGILYFRIHDYTEQQAVINLLPQLLQQHPQIRLVVIDSVTFHFRQDFRDMAHRSRILTQMAQDLMRVAENGNLAVVLMNQVTTRVLEDQTSKLVPALGESWGHAASTRVILHWTTVNGRSERSAYLYKSPCMPPASAPYLVTTDGVRSCPKQPSVK